MAEMILAINMGIEMDGEDLVSIFGPPFGVL